MWRVNQVLRLRVFLSLRGTVTSLRETRRNPSERRRIGFKYSLTGRKGGVGNDTITRILSGRIYCEKERDGNSGGSEKKIGGGKRRKGTTTKKKK